MGAAASRLASLMTARLVESIIRGGLRSTSLGRLRIRDRRGRVLGGDSIER